MHVVPVSAGPLTHSTTTAQVWSVHSDTAELVASAKEHAGGIMGLWIQGTTVVSGSQDKTIKVWTLRRSGG